MISLEQLINFKETIVYMDGDVAFTWDGERTFRAYVAQGYRESWELIFKTPVSEDHTLASAKEYVKMFASQMFGGISKPFGFIPKL